MRGSIQFSVIFAATILASTQVYSLEPCVQSGSRITCVYQPRPFSLEDLWPTSVYTYGFNGVIDDEKIQVGGWGDTYCAYVKLGHNPTKCTSQWCGTPKNPLEGLPTTLVSKATLQLFVFDRGDSSTPTQMLLGPATVNWNEGWANLPSGQIDYAKFQYQYFRTLQAPQKTDGWYNFEVTDIYKKWSDSTLPNYGIALCPVSTGNNFNAFRSSDYSTVSRRPKLTLQFDDPSPINIKMPLKGGMEWLLTTEIGGRDCAFDSLLYLRDSSLTPSKDFLSNEVDKAHTDWNLNGTGTYFSLDFTNTALVNGKPTTVTAAEVRSPVDAKVAMVDLIGSGPNGKFVRLQFGKYYEVRLLHLASIESTITNGVSIAAGQKIGIMGKTGVTNGGINLHITFLYNGRGTSNIPALTKLRMEGLLLKQYQTECSKKGQRNAYYLSTNSP